MIARYAAGCITQCNMHDAPIFVRFDVFVTI